MTTIVKSDRWQLLSAERETIRSKSIFAKIGSNRVPDDDPAYIEGENAPIERINHIVKLSMM